MRYLLLQPTVQAARIEDAVRVESMFEPLLQTLLYGIQWRSHLSAAVATAKQCDMASGLDGSSLQRCARMFAAHPALGATPVDESGSEVRLDAAPRI